MENDLQQFKQLLLYFETQLVVVYQMIKNHLLLVFLCSHNLFSAITHKVCIKEIENQLTDDPDDVNASVLTYFIRLDNTNASMISTITAGTR
jgi:hypothetical protein